MNIVNKGVLSTDITVDVMGFTIETTADIAAYTHADFRCFRWWATTESCPDAARAYLIRELPPGTSYEGDRIPTAHFTNGGEEVPSDKRPTKTITVMSLADLETDPPAEATDARLLLVPNSSWLQFRWIAWLEMSCVTVLPLDIDRDARLHEISFVITSTAPELLQQA